MSFCETLGPCQRPECARPACEHTPERWVHMINDPEKPCAGYVPSPEQAEAFGEFEGGGGSGGGGGASGTW